MDLVDDKVTGMDGTQHRLSLLSSLLRFPLEMMKKNLTLTVTGNIVAHAALEGENTVAAVLMKQVASCARRLLGID